MESEFTICLNDEEIHILLCALVCLQSCSEFQDSAITIFGIASRLSLASYQRFIPQK